MTSNDVTELWGNFHLSPDPGTAVAEAPVARSAARVTDFPFLEGESPWHHRFGTYFGTLDAAGRDARIPLPSFVPSGEEFLVAGVLDDGRGAASGMIAWARTAHPDYRAYAGGTQGGDDHTLWIGWSSLYSRPAFMRGHVDPLPVNGATLAEATVIEDALLKVAVQGNPGVLRTWKSTDGQSLFGPRLPAVILNWFDSDGTFWTVQATFASPDEVLRIAESIRSTKTK